MSEAYELERVRDDSLVYETYTTVQMRILETRQGYHHWCHAFILLVLFLKSLFYNSHPQHM